MINLERFEYSLTNVDLPLFSEIIAKHWQPPAKIPLLIYEQGLFQQPAHPPPQQETFPAILSNRITLPQHKPHSIVHHHLPVCLLAAPQPHQALSGSRFMYEEATIKTMEAVARH